MVCAAPEASILTFSSNTNTKGSMKPESVGLFPPSESWTKQCVCTASAVVITAYGCLTRVVHCCCHGCKSYLLKYL